jgi:glutamate-1-semialdehyde aminotransferase
MAGVRTTPQQATEKWVTRLSGATAEITAGIDRVTEAPGIKAAAKKAKWLAAVQASQDKWANNVSAVSLEQWKTLFKTVGVQRIAQGAQAKKSKMQNFLNQFLPHLEQGIQTVNAMPDTTFEDRIQKSVAMMRHNHNFKRTS